PNLVHVLNYPKNHEAWFDIVMNEVDGEWYEERNPITLAPRIDIPVWLQIDQGRGWTMDGTIEVYKALKGPKKLDIGPYPPMQSRPFIEEHDKMFRWYEYWLKGIDNGIMDEPAVTVHVEGSRETVTGAQWPPKDVEHKSLHLRPRRKLSFEPELMGAEYAAPDGFYQAPLTVTDKVEILNWSTAPFTEPTR
ncbi:X-Pro dipeptidyl-peptidase, partial [Streptomyces beijiangensis]|nr:X-Pro dipeptidyl-peptidase [Streptomyces beijiangensis]